ncbi:MAG: hypothetical protein OQL05_07180 [Gammaproteobacteria bacterium]|nr:hypothetical protein [Gammaproteobacteria bacterium]MCW8959265.1 hypothetical protein [Gammaproteobacteria bacterium]MCW8973049.1 hypothetical protein [Gammaproteobacteria bacterium]MCW8992807.1 hypothetical protein [Gammaproteobacteria bacterium]
MKPIKKLLNVLPALLVLTLSAPATAGDNEGVGPNIPAPVKGEQCVEDTDVMRKNHMKFLMKHRDETLREGIRTKQHSLKECIECHVPAKDEAQATRSEGEHFCKSCHMYTGVKIDCFECHATVPEKSAMFHPLVTPGMKAAKEAHQPASAELLNKLAAEKNNTGAIQ